MTGTVAQPKQKPKVSRQQRMTDLTGYLYILPNFLGFFIFTAFPLVFAFVLSFFKWDAITAMEFVGLDNYLKLFRDSSFFISLRNTLYYTVVSVPLTLGLGLALALLLNKGLRLSRFYQAAFFIPNVASLVSVSIVWQVLYHPDRGPINMFLRAVGVADPPAWTSSSTWAMPAIILMSVWCNAGYYMVIFFASLRNIPTTYYEAARIDGANTWQQFRNVTIPMLSPTTFFTSIIAIINSFKVIDQVLLLTGGGPGRATNVLVFFIYRNSFEHYKFGYASSAAYVLFAIIFVLTLVQYRLQDKWVNY